MRYGLLADIHEAVEPLGQALAMFRQQGVDEVIVLGDICRMHRRLPQTVALLVDARAVGVWGNHDFGLCHKVSEELRRRFTPAVIDFTTTLQPTLVREDCLFTHVEPWLDATDVTQLWYFDGPPQTPAQVARSFDAASQRVLFSGHIHQWLLADETGVIDWDGSTPLRLAPPRRYLVALHAVVAGHAAIYDSATGDLLPIRLSVPVEIDE